MTRTAKFCGIQCAVYENYCHMSAVSRSNLQSRSAVHAGPLTLKNYIKNLVQAAVNMSTIATALSRRTKSAATRQFVTRQE